MTTKIKTRRLPINSLVFYLCLLFANVLIVHAQQVKIGTNVANVRQGSLLELDDNTKALLLTRVANPATKIGKDSYKGMLVYDSSTNQLAFYNGTKWTYPIIDTPADQNIYVVNGILTGNRQVNLGGFGLAFTQGSDSLYLKGGKVGLSINPISALHVKGAIRTDSLVISSNKLYKVLNKTLDSVAILDSIGRVMKAGISDVINFAVSNVLDWQYIQTSGTSGSWIVPNVLIGGELAAQGLPGTFGGVEAGARSNYIPAKDSVIVNLDVYVTPLGTSTNRAGFIGLKVLEYSDAFGTSVKTSTLVTLVTGNTLGSGLVASKWNNDLVYRTKLDAATKFVRIEYYVNANNVASGNGFKNMKVLSYGANSPAPFVNGGNAFGETAVLGTNDTNALSIITNNTNRIYIASGGNVGIGNTSPSYKLDVTGEVKTSGTLYTTKVQGISDARLKKDVSPIQGALSKVLQLKGVTYTWRKDMEKQAGYTFRDGMDYGFIAQEVQKILPELVEQDKNGFFTVDYPHIVPILIEAIKEQKKGVDSLRLKVQAVDMTALKAKVQAVDVDALKAKVQEIDQLMNEVSQLKAQIQQKK